MCGIIGYTGRASALEALIEGLFALEYRGYDSAGVAFFDEQKKPYGALPSLTVVKTVGRIAALREKLSDRLASGQTVSRCGIGHTRWATHGIPSDRNAHPHGTAHVQLVHNGIIENYAAIRDFLLQHGYAFASETDTEAAALLIDYMATQYDTHAEAVRAAARKLTGSYAICAVFADEPGVLYATRLDNPLIIGAGDGEFFAVSDLTAILSHTRTYYRLNNRELAVLTPQKITFYDENGNRTEKQPETATWDVESARRGGYEHFMLKEIHEGPDAIRKTLAAHAGEGLSPYGADPNRLRAASSLTIVACGTALNAGALGKIFFEKYAGLPVHTEIASEFRYRNPVFGPNDLVMVISQSGETADTLAALRLARERSVYTLAVVNVVGSSIAREADCTIYTCAGPEIAVASTKAYSVQTALLADFALRLGVLRGSCTAGAAEAAGRVLRTALPETIEKILAAEIPTCRQLADRLRTVPSVFYIGRGQDCCSAQEAALKMKEISYIHCEAYAAGEMKHGTISLIEPGVPVIALCTHPKDSVLRGKMLANVREVQTRGAFLLCVTTEPVASELTDRQIVLPPIESDFAPIAAMTVLQLLAYYTAVAKGTDVDKPRNLAKSVTVE